MPRTTPQRSIARDRQAQVDARARALRAECAQAEARGFLDAWKSGTWHLSLQASPFSAHADDYPLPEGPAHLAFSLHITDRVVRSLCAGESDPETLYAVASRVAELGTQVIANPFDPTAEPRLFLAAAKHWGYFFTPLRIAAQMAALAIPPASRLPRVIDPAAGLGSLLAAAMIRASTVNAKLGEVTALELDPFTSALCALLLERVRDLLGLPCEVLVRTADATEVLLAEASRAAPRGFDALLMNPPYGRVKFLRSFLTNAETRLGSGRATVDEMDAHWKTVHRQNAARLRQVAEAVGVGNGRQDYHRIFLGLALAALGEDARAVVIAPSSWLGDADSRQLRNLVLGGGLLREVCLYDEAAGLFATVNQPTAVAVFSKANPRGTRVQVSAPRRNGTPASRYAVDIQDLQRRDSHWLRIPRTSEDMYHIVEALQKHGRLGGEGRFRNARGELDLTTGRRFITSKATALRLVRGDHLERYVLRDPESSERDGYVLEAAYACELGGRGKAVDGARYRLAGRQCSYMGKGRRLSFAIVPPGVVLANSCNYISCTGKDASGDLTTLHGLAVILNSAVLEWYFRLYSSNNHVANYEIDDFPICLADPNIFGALCTLGEYLHGAYRTSPHGGKAPTHIEDLADALVAHAFGLTPEQTYLVVAAIEPARAGRLRNLSEWLSTRGLPDEVLAGTGWFNHLPPKLSALDMEIVRHVPQGGNWQNIPKSVPSARLRQIREMTAWRGVVRTTYYGRLRPDQPAYTIATYYNRPGNGTNIVPWEDRTLTSREAARLQSFPDWYVFLGPEASVRKQVGNAVPPLLSYGIGKHLRTTGAEGPCLDLYAGAGGLSLGLELAGWNVLAAVDNDRRAAETYRFNRPCEVAPDPDSDRTLFCETDLTRRAQRAAAMDHIKAKLKGRRLSLIAGGPPCQGFSHAGWRAEGDKRNDLASIFMMFVKEFRPTLVLLENVEGLLTFGKGQVLRDLIATLTDLGYSTQPRPWVLRAECFGAPQMRRRVFLVGRLAGDAPTPPQPRFSECRGRRAAEDEGLFGSLPAPVTAAEALSGLPALGPRTHSEMGRRPVRGAYDAWCKGLISTEGLLTQLAARG